jgi:hypothetical protein
MDISNLAYAFFNSPGAGGVVVLVVFGVASGLYFYLTRWIIKGGKKDRQ